MTSFDGAEFLATARELKDGSEADKRSAISRAYYAAFLLAKEYARVSDGSVIQNDGSDHATVPRYLERLRHFSESQKLQKLKDYRHACDYAKPVRDLDAKVATSIASADGIVRKYKAMLNKKMATGSKP